MDATVGIELELGTDVPTGVVIDVVCAVTENARTLRFTGYGFEEE